MLGLGRSRGRHALAFTVAASVVLLAAHPAAAKAKAKKPRSLDRAATESLASPARPLVALPERPRFFTINDVLAKRSGSAGSVRVASLDPGTVSDAPQPAQRQRPVSSEPFGLFTFRAPEGLLWMKWRRIAAEMAADLEAVATCRREPASCAPAATRFLKLVDAARAHDGTERIETTNRYINQSIRYFSDLAQHGVADQWSAPLATLAAGAGDCEDYAILKYAVLRESGVAADDLRLVLVRDLISRQDHAVLAVRNQGRWAALDNRWSAVMQTTELARFLPLFAIDEQGVNLFAAPYASKVIEDRERVVPAADQSEVAVEAVNSFPSLPLRL